MADCLQYLFERCDAAEPARVGTFVEGMTEEQILSEKLFGPAVIGADFERIFLLDKKNRYVGAKIRTGSFTSTDIELQSVEMEMCIRDRSKESALNSYIVSGEYPDFISGDTSLYEAGALLPLDEYWENYPNIKNYLTEEQWERFRRPDGHIYWIPQFGVTHGEDVEVTHSGEAFWIQTRVLKWAGYPEIHTVDEYFDLIERYVAANPVMEDGTPNIPFTILCDDWRYFCLENIPQFMDGYPNDGSCIVDPDRCV